MISMCLKDIKLTRIYEEYVQIARELLAELLSDDAISFVSVRRFVFKCRIRINEFALVEKL
jgi:hypothetical protein